MDESKLAADLRVELRDRTEQLAKAEATIERVRELCRRTIQRGEHAVHVDDVLDRLNGEEA
jgi:hypothetical protein